MFKRVPLRFPYFAFEPYLDAATMKVHYEGHYKTYADNLNNFIKHHRHEQILPRTNKELFKDLQHERGLTYFKNNGGGYWNHGFFFSSLAPPKTTLEKLLAEDFFKPHIPGLKIVAKNIFGSGYAWLVIDKKYNAIMCHYTINQNVPPPRYIPLLNIDVWEHAYYLKYKNKREDYIESIFNVIDWSVVYNRYIKAKKSSI